MASLYATDAAEASPSAEVVAEAPMMNESVSPQSKAREAKALEGDGEGLESSYPAGAPGGV